MASRLLSRNSRLVAYLPNLRSVVRHFRAFSSYDEKQSNDGITEIIIDEQRSGLPDPQLEVLGIQDQRLPFPGMTGPSPQIQGQVSPDSAPQQPPNLDFLREPLPQERHSMVLQQLAARIHEDALEQESSYLSDSVTAQSEGQMVECVSQDCPELMKKDFQDLFPGRNLSESPLTVITISQKSVNDMSGWSEEVEEERLELLDQFVKSAQDICLALHEAGYWADFIDPSSGSPYLQEAHTNATLFETDERYRQLGFEIEDLGCCKVISHHLWGTRAYVGSLFTNAPCEHPILKDLSRTKDD